MSIGKRSRQGDIKPLSGLMFCADCGFKVKLRSRSRMAGGKKNPHKVVDHSYNCTTYSQFGKSACPSHFIALTDIEQIVLDDIRSMASLVVADEDSARKMFLARKQKYVTQQTSADKEKLQSGKHRIAELDTLMQSVYEDKVLGNIPASVCAKLLEKYETEQQTLIAEVQRLERELLTMKQDEQDVEKFMSRLRRYADVQSLTREMCLELIEYITVDKLPENKETLRDIHIFYKFIDKGYTLKQD